MSVGDTGELSGHKRLGGEEDRNLNVNMINGDLGTPSCICKVKVLWGNMGSKYPIICEIQVSQDT